MPLEIDSTGNISTPAGDTGTYTWADVVALNSAKLDKFGDSSKPLYRWRGVIELTGTATLAIKNINLELYGADTGSPGIIRATDTAKIIFGTKTTVGGKEQFKDGCNIVITRYFFNNSFEWTLYAPLSYSKTGRLVTGAITGGEVRIYASRIQYSSLYLIPTAEKRIVCFISELQNSIVSCEDNLTAFGTGITAILYFRKNSVLKNNRIHSVYPELLGDATISSLETYSTSVGLAAYIGYSIASTIRVEVQQLSAADMDSDYYVDNRTAFDFINSPDINLANARIENTQSSNSIKLENKKVFTHDLKLISDSNAVVNAQVVYSGRSNVSGVSNSMGRIAQLKLVSQETNLASMTTPPRWSTYSKPITLIDYSSYVRQIKSYLHKPVSETIAVTEQVGTDVQPFQYSLSLDDGITQTNTTTVSAYTGIAHTSTTITVTQSRTLNEIYDSRKLYWRNNTGINPPYKESDVFNLGGANLVIDGVTLVPSTKFNFIETTGTVTFLNNGTVFGLIVTDSTGTIVPLSVTGAIAGASVRIYRSPIETYPTPILSGVADATGKVAGNFLYTGSDIPVIVVARLFGYLPFNENNLVNGTIGSRGLSVLVSMQNNPYVIN